MVRMIWLRKNDGIYERKFIGSCSEEKDRGTVRTFSLLYMLTITNKTKNTNLARLAGNHDDSSRLVRDFLVVQWLGIHFAPQGARV